MIRAIGAIVIMGTLIGITSGCGAGASTPSSTTAGTESFQHNTLSEVAELLTIQKDDAKKPPQNATAFQKYRVGFPNGFKSISDGDVVVVWGATIQDGASDKVIAYEKQTPELGGFVLMQDGTTIKKMTADQFKSASKAAGAK
ncbi:hypothetical protein [Singulisphaera acidiphila]|uniref:Lipoprotein n=1 Tax=Singulisphaera acidiphila (strain ATCC BAA-1392 / DSM 18658 / VKM B-2454 / MOB10) TaxID=886293 RepID=L0D8S4_SINAD|nr:hypothetical protein [Singulisphaera acidiphila]AGA25233.1 hypothetical protein Sinac_0826 [Singulisphaera acidiphila DSM 18658]